VRITRCEPARPPITTYELWLDQLVSNIGESAMNSRMGDKVARGGTKFLNARVSAGNEANAIYTAEISARANPGNWKPALEEAALELQRARMFGFTQHEIDDVKKEMLAGAERSVQTESTTPAGTLIRSMNGAVSSGNTIMSPQQRLDLLKKTLPTITKEQIDQKFAKEFDPTTVAFVAVLPSGPNVPSESDLLAAGTKALEAKPTQEAEVATATQLMTQTPPAGQVAEGEEHAATKVWSGWLSNNVRLHYRFMDQRKDDVSVGISLIGGELLETADTRGITTAAHLAWARPATQHLSSTDIRELMTGKQVNVRGGGGGFGGGRGGGRRGGGGGGGGAGDSINLSISGSPEDLETGFQLAYLLLTEPKIEAAPFDQFKTTMREMLGEALKNPMMVGMRTAGRAAYPDDEPRTQPLTADQVDKLSLDAAQAWLERLIKESPIEVVIVGDLPKDRAMELATKYLGAVPSRQRVTPSLYADLRKLKRPAGPRVFEKTVETPTKQAFVMSGFYGTDETNRADVRALNMAARLLSTRMIKEVREDAQLVYSIGASSRAASTYPGFGVFSANAPTDPPKADALVAKLASMYEQFAAEGPSEEEMIVARKQFANTYEEQLKEPGFWSGRLNQLTFRGISLDDLVNEPDAYQALTAKDVKDTFAKYYSKDNSIVVVVKPQSAAAQPVRSSDAGR
jgi:zinc protease